LADGRSVTTQCRLYCQGAKCRQHMIESGMDPDAKLFNLFFTKADASVCSGREAVTRPAHVMLLDYEIELALVSPPNLVARDSDARNAARLCVCDHHS
jgi:2-keto-4-pentenoate hydratase/2-oxohepta-3-ene-1,7-dioic acid hydratase in catechol pathway